MLYSVDSGEPIFPRFELHLDQRGHSTGAEPAARCLRPCLGRLRERRTGDPFVETRIETPDRG